MKTNREKRGQFVIIAVMLTAIMIVSIGALMHGAVTYYRHEPWEEYFTLVGDIEVNSRRLVELSLASYTNSLDDDFVLKENLEKWQNDLGRIYPIGEIVLTHDPNSRMLSSNPDSSNPMAKAVFSLDINSIGLKGYEFSIVSSLNLGIKVNSGSTYNITASVTTESGEPVTGLDASNFKINDNDPAQVIPVYEGNTLVYEITFEGTFPATVEVWDERGIRAVANVV